MNRITFTHSFKQFKYKRIGIIVSVFLSLLLIMLGCKKIEQPDMATVTDPCDCAKEVSADFLMEEIYCFSYPDNSPSKI